MTTENVIDFRKEEEQHLTVSRDRPKLSATDYRLHERGVVCNGTVTYNRTMGVNGRLSICSLDETLNGGRILAASAPIIMLAPFPTI